MKNYLIALISVVVTAVIVGGGVYYFMQKKADANLKTLNDQIATLRQQVEDATPAEEAVAPAHSGSSETDPTTTWETLEVSSRNLSFKYPASLGTPKLEEYQASEDAPYIDIDSYNIQFEGNRELQTNYAEIIRYSDYENDSQFKTKADTIKKIYTTRKADGGEKLYATFINAAFLAAGEPHYLETADGKYRGIYYFANIGQAYSTTIDCIMLMTDGTDNVIQFHFSQEADNANQYTATLNQDNSPFAQYVEALTSTSSESIVQDFMSTYKYMALSLKSLE